MSKIKAVIILMLAAALLASASCAKMPDEVPTTPPVTSEPSPTPEPTTEPTPTEEPTPEPTATPEPTPDPANTVEGTYNYLTGLEVTEEQQAKRPYAIMINNIKAALPQHGTSQADFIFETLVEGGCTRLLVVFSDVSAISKIGSIRSARHDYLELADSIDAIFIHCGGSPQAYAALSGRTDTAVDAIYTDAGGSIYRDKDRTNAGYAYEHTLFAKGALLQAYLDSSSKLRQTHGENYTPPFEFVIDGTPAGGFDAVKISAKFSTYKTGVFDYDGGTGKYLVSQFGAPMTDGNNGEQLSVTNVIVIKTDINTIKGDNKGRQEVDLRSGGEGYFFCGGKGIEITWEKASSDDQFVLRDKATGEIIKLQQGVTYFNIVPTNMPVTIS